MDYSIPIIQVVNVAGIEMAGGLTAALLGLVASSFAALLTQPVDVIKTRLMTSGIVPLASLDPGQVRSLVEDTLCDHVSIFGTNSRMLLLCWEVVKNQCQREEMEEEEE